MTTPCPFWSARSLPSSSIPTSSFVLSVSPFAPLLTLYEVLSVYLFIPFIFNPSRADTLRGVPSAADGIFPSPIFIAFSFTITGLWLSFSRLFALIFTVLSRPAFTTCVF
jgi:hypothetical protein